MLELLNTDLALALICWLGGNVIGLMIGWGIRENKYKWDEMEADKAYQAELEARGKQNQERFWDNWQDAANGKL